eukprot:SAG31_NODE_25931_length_451_cov_0.971591_1_plen_107_part_10
MPARFCTPCRSGTVRRWLAWCFHHHKLPLPTNGFGVVQPAAHPADGPVQTPTGSSTYVLLCQSSVVLWRAVLLRSQTSHLESWDSTLHQRPELQDMDTRSIRNHREV